MAKSQASEDIKFLDLTSVLAEMEGTEFDSHESMSKNYASIVSSLHDPSTLDLETTERLLAICMKHLENNIMQYSSNAAMVISLILKKIKKGKCEYNTTSLVQSALTILNATKMWLPKPQKWFRKLNTEVLLLYPDTVLMTLVMSHSKDVIDFIDYYPKLNFNNELTEWTCQFLTRLLEILSPEMKLDFVQKGLDAWFTTVIPTVMAPGSLSNTHGMKHKILALELLTESLKHIDYSENPKWQNVLRDICDPTRYPAFLKSSLEGGSDYWHTFWNIFIILLKDQITKVNKSGKSPINALLPTVELAFKMHAKCRCKAFECWNVLIDNFSTELNEALIDKRLKLLMTPLKLNNAKVVETVMAKFNTWWHLIFKFQHQIDKFTETVLMPFMHFCFGKPSGDMTAGENVVATPGQMTSALQQKCVQVLVEVVGHVDCEGCCILPRVNVRLITTKLLVEYWTLWRHCLYVALKTSAMNYSAAITKQIKCLWTGFLTIIAELPDNQIRADLFIELLKCAESLLELCKDMPKMGDIIFEILIPYLLDTAKVRPLLKTKNDAGPIHVIVLRIILSSESEQFYTRPGVTFDDQITQLKPIATLLMDSSVSDSNSVVSSIFYSPKSLKIRLALWANIAETITESSHTLKSNTIAKMVLWPLQTPLQTIDLLTENYEVIWYRWNTLYSYVHPMANSTLLEQELEKTLVSQSATQKITNFRICVALALLKQRLVKDKNAHCENQAQILLDLLEVTADTAYFPIQLTDTLEMLMLNASARRSKHLFEIVLKLLHITFQYINKLLKNNTDVFEPIFINKLQDNSRKFLDKIKPFDESLKPSIENIYKVIAEVNHTLNSITNPSKSVSNLDDSANNSDNIIITKTTEQKQNSEKSNSVIEKNFTTPEPIVKQAKKKELNIVNTVVENGEEYVVVKSHWKFNPKKLTENQKEKFKRKREDIPALYQDLSQSQDEFKLRTWRTDSQDATTSSNSKSESNSKTNDNVVAILQKLPNTEVVPKIIENVFAETADKNDGKPTDIVDNNNKLPKTPPVMGPKTPRLALKDRVFRNVRNLIEKSGLQTESKVPDQVTKDVNQTVNENDLNTPVVKAKPEVSLVNSAPPKISSERPARSIKKPKKFEDVEIFAIKKKRRSQDSSQSDTQQGSAASHKKIEALKEPPAATEVLDENKTGDKNDKDIIENQDVLKPSDLNIDNNDTPSLHEVAVTSIVATQTEQINIVSDHAKNNNDKMEIVQSDNQDIIVLQEQPILANNENSSQIIDEISTPKSEKFKQKGGDLSTNKKKRSRIAKQLLIDMVEGHPVLQQSQSEKRVTRKKFLQDDETNSTVSKRRKSLIEKSNKIKAELLIAGIVSVETKEKNKPGSKSSSPKSVQHKTPTATEKESIQQPQTVTIVDSQDRSAESQEMPMSEDVIESSQESTMTTISVKSASKKKVPIVCLDKENIISNLNATETQNLINSFNKEVVPLNDTLNDSCNQVSKEDIELPKNKTMPEENMVVDLTQNMDTQPIDSSGEVILITEEVATPIVLNTEETAAGKETQETAEADTLPIDVESQSIPPTSDNDDAASKIIVEPVNITIDIPSQDDIPPTISNTAEVITDLIVESSNTDSPLKNEIEKKKKFLNDTIEISPIKRLSPVREKKSPSPENSGDYVVIKLTSPVQSNGEPYNEKCDSPEVFTEDKVSPDKRDQSPPRKEVSASNSSPSSSLSLKKNRPQMRFNGRAAQMLGLCIPENLQMLNTDRSENDEGKKSSPASTPVRRNLKRFYAAGDNENQTNENESEETANFLSFTRTLPAAESSPANPILKRKLVDMADECTMSPASKRKRVSFHDPPVSTTVAVQKYIEPCGVRSPSNSAMKRQERQIRTLTNAKSSKRLDNVFRLESVLTKAVESFSNDDTINDTELSLDETPAAEVVKTSELNDSDPICPELLDCKDPIENIAGELSSPSTKALLIKELEGKVETVADLAKMTELEVNRLCIKAPKVKVAKKVLSKYAADRVKPTEESAPATLAPPEDVSKKLEVETVNVEVQTLEVSTKSSEMQTDEVTKVLIHTQTEAVSTKHCSAQTLESGSKSTKDVVSSCLNERNDFVEQLTQQLQQSSIRQISEKLPFDACVSLLLDKMTASNSAEALNQVILHTSNYTTKKSRMNLNILQDYLSKAYDSKDLILFSSQLLQKIHDKPS